MSREKILAKIQKLLVLTGSPNKHEAEVAAAKASSIMLEHNIAMSEVDNFQDDDTSEWVESILLSQGVNAYDISSVGHILKKYFFVLFFRDVDFVQGEYRKIIKVFGEKQNIEVAEHVFIYLRRRFRDEWKRYKKATGAGKRSMRPFMVGLAKGFTDKMEAERQALGAQSKNALVLVEDNLLEKAREAGLRLMSRRVSVPFDPEAREAGRIAGGKINLHDPVRGRSAPSQGALNG